MSKCQFFRYGSSGSVETIDTICVLPINIYNEKIFIFLWFWYCFLVMMTSIVILLRFVLICCPIVRYYIFRWRFQLADRKGDRSCDLRKLIVHKLKIGDWFILHMVFLFVFENLQFYNFILFLIVGTKYRNNCFQRNFRRIGTKLSKASKF
jgi:hypothetical protein